jgi:hypothetical protein
MSTYTLYHDPCGVSHQVTVVETVGKNMSLIEYYDNDRRGIRFKNGRKYSHATRMRVLVYNHELKHLTESENVLRSAVR